MKSLTFLVFYTNVVLKIVILYVSDRIWFWRRYDISEAGFKILEISKKRFCNAFRFHAGCLF